jgi:hypothetical protein
MDKAFLMPPFTPLLVLELSIHLVPKGLKKSSIKIQ